MNHDHEFVAQTKEAIRDAGLCEGCPKGIEVLREVGELAAKQMRDDDSTDEEIEIALIAHTDNLRVQESILNFALNRRDTVRAGQRKRREELLMLEIFRLEGLGKMNREQPCEGGLDKSQLPRIDHETWRDKYTDEEIRGIEEEARATLSRLKSLLGDPPERESAIHCELVVRNGERMRNQFYGGLAKYV